jgi:hypothetical protein
VTDAASALVRVHVHRLDLGAQATTPMQVPEDDELADPDDLVTQLRHQDGARAFGYLVQGGSVEGEVATLGRGLARDGAAREELDDTGKVGVGGSADQDMWWWHRSPKARG